jgi:hypothetical protein
MDSSSTSKHDDEALLLLSCPTEQHLLEPNRSCVARTAPRPRCFLGAMPKGCPAVATAMFPAEACQLPVLFGSRLNSVASMATKARGAPVMAARAGSVVVVVSRAHEQTLGRASRDRRHRLDATCMWSFAIKGGVVGGLKRGGFVSRLMSSMLE